MKKQTTTTAREILNELLRNLAEKTEFFAALSRKKNLTKKEKAILAKVLNVANFYVDGHCGLLHVVIELMDVLKNDYDGKNKGKAGVKHSTGKGTVKKDGQVSNKKAIRGTKG